MRNFKEGERVVIPATVACGRCVCSRAGYTSQCDVACPGRAIEAGVEVELTTQASAGLGRRAGIGTTTCRCFACPETRDGPD